MTNVDRTSESVAASAETDQGGLVVETVEAVRRYTKDVFAAAAAVTVIRDPEFGDQSFLVSVECHGGVDELVERSDRWHRNLHVAAKNQTHLFALSVIPLDERD